MPLTFSSHFLYPLSLLVFAALVTALAAPTSKLCKLFLVQRRVNMLSKTRHFVLPDQRRMAYAIYGAQSAPLTVFYFHGAPSSHHEAYLLAEAGQRHGIRIVAPSRPGSGGSTTYENGALLDYPHDILALANYLEIPSFGIVAASGGAPFAFACRRIMPDSRLKGLGVVAGIYPVTSLGTAGMKLPSRLMILVAAWFPGLVAWLIDKQLGAVARDEDEKKLETLLVADMRQESTPAGERLAWEAASPEIRKAVVTAVREGVRYGGRGPAWEMRLFGSHWGFELQDVQPSRRGELVMWHGDLDANVPLSMAKAAAARLGHQAELRVVRGHGHGSLTFHQADEIMETMKAILGSKL